MNVKRIIKIVLALGILAAGILIGIRMSIFNGLETATASPISLVLVGVGGALLLVAIFGKKKIKKKLASV